jgi:hypothetical protein
MSNSVFEEQQRRAREAKWYGPWDSIREAILAAKGARECADVEAEQRADLAHIIDVKIEACKIATYDTEIAILLGDQTKRDPYAPTLVDALYKEKHSPLYEDRFGGVGDEG